MLDVGRGRNRLVAEAQGNAMCSVHGHDRKGSGRVPTGHMRRGWESQLSTVLGKSEILRDGREGKQSVSMAERGGVRAAAGVEMGIQIIRQCGYRGELGGEWKEYAVWLGKRHRQRVWGEYFSNAMVVAIQVILFERRYNS